MTVNVYSRYYAAECVYNERPRHAARVMLISDSESGHIRYEAAVTFFPHDDEDDYAVSYDAYASETMYEGDGRRSKKREKVLMEEFQTAIDRLSVSLGGKVFWDEPLKEAEFG